MQTLWEEEEVSHDFDRYDDWLEWLLGYPYVFEAIGCGNGPIKKILDYGCGPGKVCKKLAEINDGFILGVDESKEMLKIAEQTRKNKAVTYKYVENDSLNYIDSCSFDASMLCFVLLNIGRIDQLKRILAENFRVLKPGGVCSILETHPKSIGIKFSTFLNGEPHKTYSDGDARKAWLYLPQGDSLDLEGYFWSLELYRELLLDVGFSEVTHVSPTLQSLDNGNLASIYGSLKNAQLTQEWQNPPFIILKAVKGENNA